MPSVATESPVTWPNVCFDISLTSHESASGDYKSFMLFNPHGNDKRRLTFAEPTCVRTKSTEIMVLEYGLSTNGVSFSETFFPDINLVSDLVLSTVISFCRSVLYPTGPSNFVSDLVLSDTKFDGPGFVGLFSGQLLILQMFILLNDISQGVHANQN